MRVCVFFSHIFVCDPTDVCYWKCISCTDPGCVQLGQSFMSRLLRLSDSKRQSVARGGGGVHRGLNNFYMPPTVMACPAPGCCVLLVHRALAVHRTTGTRCCRSHKAAPRCGVGSRDSLQGSVFNDVVKKGSEFKAGHKL